MTISKWDRRFYNLAVHVSSWSKDNSTQVGAVIVDNKKRIISVGFNGFPAGVNDTITSREQKLRRTVHAEVNALSFANGSVEGCTLYVTHAPCANCAAIIIQHGIGAVAFPEPEPAFLERWGESYEEAMKMFQEAGVYIMEIV
jgi:dCMP deaminase